MSPLFLLHLFSSLRHASPRGFFLSLFSYISFLPFLQFHACQTFYTLFAFYNLFVFYTLNALL